MKSIYVTWDNDKTDQWDVEDIQESVPFKNYCALVKSSVSGSLQHVHLNLDKIKSISIITYD